MPNKKPINGYSHSRLVFLQEALKHPFQIGSIIPSSRFLERRVVAAAAIEMNALAISGPFGRTMATGRLRV